MNDSFYSLDILLSFYAWFDWSDSERKTPPSTRLRLALADENNQ